MIAKGIPNKKIGIRQKKWVIIIDFPQNQYKQLKI
jgi:hypothetical protein